MAVIVTTVGGTDTPVAVASQTFAANFNDQTALTLTPTSIKAIDDVKVVATNATAAASTAFYLNGFVPGAATAVFAGVNNATYLITLYGRI